MIPSVYDEVNQYRKAGRLNGVAMFRVLVGETYSEEKLKRTPVDVGTSLLIDVCMYVDLQIPRWVREGCTEATLDYTVDSAIKGALLYRSQFSGKYSGIDYSRFTDDVHNDAVAYVLESIRLNYDSPKRGDATFTNRVIKVMQQLGVSDTYRYRVVQDIPYMFKEFFIRGITDEELPRLVRECVGWLKQREKDPWKRQPY